MPGKIVLLIALDVFLALGGIILVIIGLIFPRNYLLPSEELYPLAMIGSGSAILALQVPAIGTTLIKSKWSLWIHYGISILQLINFPLGTAYALTFLIFLRKPLSEFIQSSHDEAVDIKPPPQNLP